MSIEENEKRLIGLKKTSGYEGKELVICLDNASKVKLVLDLEFWSNKSKAKKEAITIGITSFAGLSEF